LEDDGLHVLDMDFGMQSGIFALRSEAKMTIEWHLGTAVEGRFRLEYRLPVLSFNIHAPIEIGFSLPQS
jgi:hypothetical protein